MNSPKSTKKSLIFYYIIVLLVLLLINFLLMPNLFVPQTVEMDYGTFLSLIRSGQVEQVEIGDTTIAALVRDKSGSTVIYQTGLVNDPELVNRLLDAGVKFGKVTSQEASPIVSLLIGWVLPLAVFVGLGYLMMRTMTKRMGGGMGAMSFGKANAKVYVEAQTGKTFRDVAGQDEAKEALVEVVDFLHNPKRYEEIGATIPKGVLLVGPPGTGKTLLAKAVAGEAKVPFFSISGSEFVEMFVGMGAAKVRDLFKQASEKAPCIVFIDEIDTIGKRRDGPSAISGNDEREQTLNQLLSEMDGFDGRKGVILLAATNRPEILDKALLRPGRFDRRVQVELPDLQGRIAILQVHGRNVHLGDDVNFEAIARATAGASGADLSNIVNEGALRAVRLGRDAVSQADLEEAVETVLAGAQRKNAVISPREKRMVAYHEMGHALVAALQTDSTPVHKITIVPRTSGALGYTMQVESEETRLMTRDEAISRLTTLTAGRAAEELVLGACSSGAANDIEQATRLARSMVTRLGMSEQFDMMALETVTNQYLGG
ncbi:MAG: ATP-dependent zinc metalloprotease FtsH, partial [Candidatus Fimadaptatus sp.]